MGVTPVWGVNGQFILDDAGEWVDNGSLCFVDGGQWLTILV